MKFHRAWAVHFTKNPIVGPFGLFRNRHDGYRGGWLTALFQVQLAVVERSGWSLATSSEQLKQRQRSVMRAIRLDSRLAGHRLHRVGIAGNTVFLQVSPDWVASGGSQPCPSASALQSHLARSSGQVKR